MRRYQILIDILSTIFVTTYMLVIHYFHAFASWILLGFPTRVASPRRPTHVRMLNWLFWLFTITLVLIEYCGHVVAMWRCELKESSHMSNILWIWELDYFRLMYLYCFAGHANCRSSASLPRRMVIKKNVTDPSSILLNSKQLLIVELFLWWIFLYNTLYDQLESSPT